mmetsp:Transcript_32221/g.93191  ORF Transcript_32221/g.93191 Transcript_32221/m.93191 type:complete len:252 (+) Transcript_32221:30-785(+)
MSNIHICLSVALSLSGPLLARSLAIALHCYVINTFMRPDPYMAVQPMVSCVHKTPQCQPIHMSYASSADKPHQTPRTHVRSLCPDRGCCLGCCCRLVLCHIHFCRPLASLQDPLQHLVVLPHPHQAVCGDAPTRSHCRHPDARKHRVSTAQQTRDGCACTGQSLLTRPEHRAVCAPVSPEVSLVRLGCPHHGNLRAPLDVGNEPLDRSPQNVASFFFELAVFWRGWLEVGPELVWLIAGGVGVQHVVAIGS